MLSSGEEGRGEREGEWRGVKRRGGEGQSIYTDDDYVSNEFIVTLSAMMILNLCLTL